jgi:hypothetical protein
MEDFVRKFCLLEGKNKKKRESHILCPTLPSLERERERELNEGERFSMYVSYEKFMIGTSKSVIECGKYI